MTSIMYTAKGIPHQLSRNNHGITPLDSTDIPTLNRAVHDYEQGGGILTRNWKFGYDPLWSSPHLVARRERILRAEFATIYTDSQPVSHARRHSSEQPSQPTHLLICSKTNSFEKGMGCSSVGLVLSWQSCLTWQNHCICAATTTGIPDATK